MIFGPATTALHEIKDSDYVRFSVLALSSIFFLVDPFAAIGTFMAITAGEDKKSRARTARRGAITCFIVLTSFALIGKLIFRMFGITLPAFEIAGGLILLLIGIDMLEAKRSPTQESSGETEEAAAKDDAGIVPLGIPMLSGPGRHLERDGAGGPGPTHGSGRWAAFWVRSPLPPGPAMACWSAQTASQADGRYRHPHPGAHHGSCCWWRWRCSSL